MRLIDADNLKKVLGFFVYKLDQDTDIVTCEMYPVSEIENAPTVEAIPVEWVKKWIPKNEERYALGVNPVRDLLKDWEKENG